jgi:hypothetical protein
LVWFSWVWGLVGKVIGWRWGRFGKNRGWRIYHSLYAVRVLIDRFIIHCIRLRIIKRYDLLCIIGFSTIVFKNFDIIDFTNKRVSGNAFRHTTYHQHSTLHLF